MPLIYNGVDVDDFALPGTAQAAQWREEMRGRWGVPAQAPVIGMVGRLNAKGQDALLAVLPRLKARFSDLRLVFVGPDGLPGDHQRLLLAAQVLGLAASVVLPGLEDNIPAAMAAFDVLAHLPTDELFGLALAEAMAAGLPTVATAIGGCAEVVRANETGLLVPPGDAAALTAALSLLLARRRPARTPRGRGAAPGRGGLLAGPPDRPTGGVLPPALRRAPRGPRMSQPPPSLS